MEVAVIFTVPIRTVSGNHGHGREHWSARSRRVKGERNATRAARLGAIRTADWYALTDEVAMGKTLVVTLTRIAPRQLDDDNLRGGSLKSVRDEVAAMLGVDDRDPVVTWEYAQRKGKAKEWAVEVRIEEASETRHEPRQGTQRHEAGERRVAKERAPYTGIVYGGRFGVRCGICPESSPPHGHEVRGGRPGRYVDLGGE